MAKYIGKPQRVAELTPAQIREYAIASKSMRMIQTFGTLHNARPRDEDPVEEAPRTDQRVRLSTVLHIAKAGYPEAVVLLTWLCRRYKIFGQYVFNEAPHLIGNPGTYDRDAHMLAIVRGEAPPIQKYEPDAMPERDLERHICEAFTVYKDALDDGYFDTVYYYYNTGTEGHDDGNL